MSIKINHFQYHIHHKKHSSRMRTDCSIGPHSSTPRISYPPIPYPLGIPYSPEGTWDQGPERIRDTLLPPPVYRMTNHYLPLVVDNNVNTYELTLPICTFWIRTCSILKTVLNIFRKQNFYCVFRETMSMYMTSNHI